MSDRAITEQLKPITKKLYAATKEQKVTLEALIRKSGLRLSVPTMSRKINGKMGVTNRECAAMAEALGFEMVWDRRAFRLEKKAA